MLFPVELDRVKSGQPLTPEAGRTFIEQIILPTLARAEQLTKEEKIKQLDIGKKDFSDEELRHTDLIQRPIVVRGVQAVLGRLPENVEKLL